MPIDPSIALNAGKPTVALDNPLNSLALVSQIANAQATNALNNQTLMQNQATFAQQQRIREGLANVDPNDIGSAAKVLLNNGDATGAQALLKSDADTKKTGAETGKLTTEQQVARNGLAGQLAQSATPANWADVKGALKGIGYDTSGLPDQFDPAVQKQMVDAGTQIHDHLQNTQKLADQALEQQRINESVRNDTNVNTLGYYQANRPDLIPTEGGIMRVQPRGGAAIPVLTGAPGGAVGGGTGGPSVAGPVAGPAVPRAVANAQVPQPATSAPVAPGNVPAGVVAPQVGAPAGAKNNYQPDAIKAAGAYKDELDQQVATGQELLQRIAAQKQAMAQFNTGLGEGNRVQASQIARSLGAPDSLVTRIAGGDPAAAQEFTKLANTGAIANLRQALDGQGKTNKAEFEVFAKNSPNIELDPKAIDKIFQFQTNQYQRTYNEQQAMQKYVDANGNPAAFRSWYASQIHAGLPGIGTNSPTQTTVPIAQQQQPATVQLPSPPSQQRAATQAPAKPGPNASAADLTNYYLALSRSKAP